ncbi:MAG: 6-carboxytetrahydropterin synthase QueD [Candidatus Sericytochromatia bacterium]
MDFFELTIEVEFCASHILEGHSGKCANLHGHNYKTEVCISGNKLNNLGILVDFADIKKAVNNVVDLTLDHKHINDIDYPPFKKGQTSAENIAKYIYEKLESFFTEEKVEYVRIWETSKYSVKYSKK